MNYILYLSRTLAILLEPLAYSSLVDDASQRQSQHTEKRHRTLPRYLGVP